MEFHLFKFQLLTFNFQLVNLYLKQKKCPLTLRQRAFVFLKRSDYFLMLSFSSIALYFTMSLPIKYLSNLLLFPTNVSSLLLEE